MAAPRRALLHAGADDPVALAVQLGFFAALLLMAMGLVLVHEDPLEPRSKWGWAALIVLVPVVGPAAYLARRAAEP